MRNITLSCGTGPGVQTADGSSVELWKLIPHSGEANLIHAALRSGCDILELGAGVGRVTHELLRLDHSVTAVDFSREMLAEIRGAETVCANIADLRLGRSYGGVILGSYLINCPDRRTRKAYFDTCARHVSHDGTAIIERHPKAVLERIRPGFVGVDEKGITAVWRDVWRDGAHFGGTLEWRYDERLWTQTFTAYALSDEEVRAELSESGLRLDRFLDEEHRWIAACPAR